jgi:uncharacterized SAM-binding protein YcdF (DUF218 family)
MSVVVWTVLGLILAWGAAAAALEAYGRHCRANGSYDLLIVPGCRVLPGGGPSGHLQRRIERAVELWHEGAAPVLVFTGGPHKDRASEASVAARHARQLGVPDEALILEERSSSTEENARFSAAAADGRNVLVVTDSYHAFRSRRIFQRYFNRVAVDTVVAPLRSRLENSLREVLAIAFYAVRGRL